MVSNASSPFDLNGATVTMTFDGDVTAAQVYQKGEMKTVKLTDHKLTLELESGGGWLRPAAVKRKKGDHL